MRAWLRSWLLLAGLVGGLLLVVGIWLALDRRPPVWDHANHLERAIRCQRILAEGGERLAEILEMSAFYPPVVICAAGALSLLAGASPLASQAVILGFLVVGLTTLFAFGRRLFDAETGLLAALIFGTSPFVVYSATNFQLDLPLAAAVTLSLLALVRTETFSRRSRSVLLGLSLALGMLVKPPFAVYLLPPLALVAWRALRAPDRRRRGLNLGLSLLLGAAICVPWYGVRLLGLPLQIANRAFKHAAEAGYPETLTAASLLFYPKTLLPAFGLLAAPLFAWGLIAVLPHRGVRALLWSASVAPFVVFLFLRNKDLRYVLPIFPVAALIGAATLRDLPAPWRRGLTVALAGFSALQVGAAAFGVPPVPRWRPFDVPLVLSFLPAPAEWPHRQILDAIVQANDSAPATVSVVPNSSFFSVSNFRYVAARDGLPLTITRGWNRYPLGVEFVVLKTGEQGPHNFSTFKAERIMRQFASDPYLVSTFPLVAEYPLPDGSRAILRSRRISPRRGVGVENVARKLEAAPAAGILDDYVREAVGLRVRVTSRSEALLKGEVDELWVEAESAVIGELARAQRAPLRVRDVRVRVERLLINPHRLMETGALEILGVGALRIDRLVIAEGDLGEFLRGQPRAAGVAVTLEEGTAQAVVRALGVQVRARVRLARGDGGHPFVLRVDRVRVGGLAVPGFLVDWVVRSFDPTPRLNRLPVSVSLSEISIRPGRIEVGARARLAPRI
ncbi:MAG: glycosyltransferase family 39 protein [Candidatus Rokubacteria bacterium]|nr:glycosyltransferase family 39 protein [Candidatus Rokubacteria bacterium]